MPGSWLGIVPDILNSSAWDNYVFQYHFQFMPIFKWFLFIIIIYYYLLFICFIFFFFVAFITFQTHKHALLLMCRKSVTIDHETLLSSPYNASHLRVVCLDTNPTTWFPDLLLSISIGLKRLLANLRATHFATGLHSNWYYH